MTEQDLQSEWKYLYEERLAILCGSEIPTKAQMRLATEEADAAIRKLRRL